MPSIDPIRVAIVAYEGVSLLDLSGPLEALRVASTHPNHVGASLIYKCSVLSVHGGLVMTADGVGIATEPVSALDGHTIDTLIVPGACDVDDVRRDRTLIDWVRDRAPDCRRVCSVCVGDVPAGRSRAAERPPSGDALDALRPFVVQLSRYHGGAGRDLRPRWVDLVVSRCDDGHRPGPRADRAGLWTNGGHARGAGPRGLFAAHGRSVAIQRASRRPSGVGERRVR